MNYNEIVNYIEEIPKFTVKNPPEHTKEMLRRLGNPQDSIKVIHVAGTNGKGSTCAYLASMLSAGGYKTGLFTSPHLVKINDRFRINGEVMADEDFVISFLKVKEVIDQAKEDGYAHPSYFETLFLMGVDYYYRKKVDYLVLETGLGGGKDPTNCVEKPLACIITSISIDHVQYLGDTIPAIASEKAGIIKPGVPIIFDGHVEDAANVIEARAAELNSPSYKLMPDQYELKAQTREGIKFEFEGTELQIPYIAEYQMMNASLAYFTMKNLSTEEIYGIRMKKSVQLENHVINLTQQKKASKEQYEHNLAAEKEMRGEWDKRISVVPNNIDYDLAAWNEKRMVVIQGKEFAFADIIGYEVASRDTYRTDGIDHQNLVKNFKKKQGLGTLITGQVGVLAGTISAVAGGVNDLIQNTDLITVYTVNIRTAIQSYPTIEINVGTDEAKANEVVELINTILASNEALKAE